MFNNWLIGFLNKIASDSEFSVARFRVSRHAPTRRFYLTSVLDDNASERPPILDSVRNIVGERLSKLYLDGEISHFKSSLSPERLIVLVYRGTSILVKITIS